MKRFYSVQPHACAECATPRSHHGARHWTYPGGPHGWTAPPGWLILARMRLRRTDSARWLPDDGRTRYRKWFG